jgi:hypothetical protein
MERGYILGEISVSILEIGKIIKWMVREFLPGLILENIKESIEKIKRMVMEYLNGST